MKIKWLYGVLGCLFVGLAVVLFFEKEEECVLITSPKIYSIYHSDDLETIDIEIVTNQVDHFYVDSAYISSMSIENQESTFPVKLLDVFIQDTIVLIQDKEYYSVTFKVRTELFSTDLLVQIKDAHLHLTYLNGEQLSLYIGEFNYLFHDTNRTDLALQGLSATYEEVNGVQTVGGIHMSLHNRSNQLLEIVDIKLVAQGIQTNLPLLLKRESCEYSTKVQDCLYMDSYSFTIEPVEIELHETVLEQHTFEGYVPLSYIEYPYIDAFAIAITYKLNGEYYSFIIDDFPFMRTANFQESHEEWYHEYRPKSSDS